MSLKPWREQVMPGRHLKTWTVFCPRCKWYTFLYASREYIYDYVLRVVFPCCRECKKKSDITIQMEVLEGEHAPGVD